MDGIECYPTTNLEFGQALHAMRNGVPINRLGRESHFAIIMSDGHVLTRGTRQRIHSFPISDVLATDWHTDP